jgi:hypothetical protein
LGGSRSVALIAAAAESVAPIIAIRSFYPASGLSLVTGARSILSLPGREIAKGGGWKRNPL